MKSSVPAAWVQKGSLFTVVPQTGRPKYRYVLGRATSRETLENKVYAVTKQKILRPDGGGGGGRAGGGGGLAPKHATVRHRIEK